MQKKKNSRPGSQGRERRRWLQAGESVTGATRQIQTLIVCEGELGLPHEARGQAWLFLIGAAVRQQGSAGTAHWPVCFTMATLTVTCDFFEESVSCFTFTHADYFWRA